MLKRKPLIFLTLVIAMVALFAAAEVMATNCIAPDCVEAGGWRIEVVTPFPAILDGKTRFEWELTKVARNARAINHVALLFPICSPELVTSYGSQSLHTYDEAEGEPNGFGEGIYGTKVIEWTLNLNEPGRFWVETTPTVPRVASMLVKQNKKKVHFQILGVGCPGDDPINQTGITLTRKDDQGATYKIEIIKDSAGNILEITQVAPDGTRTDITNDGINWSDIFFCYPASGGDVQIPPSSSSYHYCEPVNFIPSDTSTETGDNSTCGYWYRGFFFNFCQ